MISICFYFHFVISRRSPMSYSYLGVKTTEINYIEINRNKIFLKIYFRVFFSKWLVICSVIRNLTHLCREITLIFIKLIFMFFAVKQSWLWDTKPNWLGVRYKMSAADGRSSVLCNTFHCLSNLLLWGLVYQMYFYDLILYLCSSEGISCHR